MVACIETHEPGVSSGAVAVGDGAALVAVAVTDGLAAAVTGLVTVMVTCLVAISEGRGAGCGLLGGATGAALLGAGEAA